MGMYDFSYEIPGNFNKRVYQFLQQVGRVNVAEAFGRCKYEYEDVGLAYYAGMKGDNWDKKALDFTIEGRESDIALLRSCDGIVKDAIGKALRPTETGFLIRKTYYFEDDSADELVEGHVSNQERLNADIASAQVVLRDLLQIGERVCSNQYYDASTSENRINDYFRDMLLAKGYDETKDQTRHGISASGKDAGEVDILLTQNGKEIAIFEGLKLESVRTAYIDEHIDKAIINYNALGTATFIVAYVNTGDFESFWERYSNHVQVYGFPLTVKESFKESVHPNAATRVGSLILSRDGFDFPVYFIAFKIS